MWDKALFRYHLISHISHLKSAIRMWKLTITFLCYANQILKPETRNRLNHRQLKEHREKSGPIDDSEQNFI